MSTKFTYAFGVLPDTDREILLNLHGKQLFTACSVNRYTYGLFDSVFWKLKFIKDYTASIGSVQAVDYRTAYNRMYIRDVDAQLVLVAKTYREGNDLITLLLDRGANIHRWRNAALRLAATNGHTTTVELLLNRGANIHCWDDHMNTVELLLDRGAAYIHCKNDSALRRAARNGHINTVELLLDHGANIHCKNDSALRRAAENGHTTTVELLLNRGADIHCWDDAALRRAAENGHTTTVELLLKRGANMHCLNNTVGMTL